MRRKDREITNINEILTIVEKSKIIHLGMFDNAFPYVVPLHFGYEYTGKEFVFYIHSAKQGHKLDLIANNPRVCVETECHVELVSGGESPCDYSSLYSSFIGRGYAETVSNTEEKIKGLSLLMKNQTGQVFDISPQMAASVEVVKIVVSEFTAKARSKSIRSGMD